MFHFKILIFIYLIFFSFNLTATPKTEKATFAGGCFWCMEGPFESLPGVISVVAGYSGGKEFYPTYQEVSRGKTGHRESVQIEFDSSKIRYEELLTVFWNQIDPTDNGGQFADRGNQYRTGIFYHNQTQKKAAEKSKREISESKKFPGSIVVEIIPFTSFYPAEDYHQNYYKTNSEQYKKYKKYSGREDYLEKMCRQR
ncbi:peptide-methionine (S)-S-oxide reductase MsrA [Leptospira interrogans]|uniref:Peptide methionine sulfoxide reductase MsrA n=3 Tax=Leptospira interrogans TaxID=173 RepID=A0A0E2D1J5_LEPIR|nr:MULTISPECIES: peptide-methionine (S)-S-oxide reductase MsrA [Leptospira]ASV09564.1 peptide-methionine (S)-S-oxide reductase [Leptospira interrogans serovar Canicola]EJO77464.1 peptide-methionine (S)-S-oxide reductase [Leptospira interrogans serovar Pomona str. Kennewicki LC82-25]EKN98580.1 peptide-methionine (S)-S-oxide reductase [Leptospira interrogans serovar Pomona str. Pomona]EKO69440.1 peptide-methionine (S)-S-oxide reductase [Leptospira interrogans serovar Canicola str. Fiocruz LV133]